MITYNTYKLWRMNSAQTAKYRLLAHYPRPTFLTNFVRLLKAFL
jgi:hypothetical protein